MKILLLGPNGQLGSDMQRAAGEHRGVSIAPLPRAELDLTNLESIRAAIASRDFDVLVNCTGDHKTDDVEKNAQRATTINALAVREIARACHDKRRRLVHVSTDYVFDGSLGRPLREDDPPAPLNVYGSTKLMGEGLARASHDDVVIFRVASLFGVAGASGKGGNFVETMIKFGKEKGQLKVVADQTMSPGSTADIARAMLGAITKAVPAGTYHAANTGVATWHQFAARIIERAGVKAVVNPTTTAEFGAPAQRPMFSALDNAKLASWVGDIPRWEDALDRYLIAKGHRAS